MIYKMNSVQIMILQYLKQAYLLEFYYLQIKFAAFSGRCFTNLISFPLSENSEKFKNGKVLRSGSRTGWGM